MRERKKQRTRETIVRTAMDLFAEQGFQGTSVIEIAAAAQVAPSTLYGYFPTKSDIVFSHHASVLDSARNRLGSRPVGESTLEALADWTATELPSVADSYATAILRRRPIIDSDDRLLAEERARLSLLEDVLADAFARDLGEAPADLRPRLMAALAVAGLHAIGLWTIRNHPGEPFDVHEPYALDHTYLMNVLVRAENAIRELPPLPLAERA